MSWKPEVKQWPSERAVLFVHGVGNAAPGSYDGLVKTFRDAVGDPNGDELATYFLYYDDVNDWISRKTKFANLIARIADFVKDKLGREGGSAQLSEAAAEFVGDVLFPVLIEANREIIQRRYLTQVQQMRLDGKTSGFDFFEQRISVICHSLGCFHTFEALSRMANDPSQRLLPVTDMMTFDNVIFMASPVQLIRTVAGALGGVVPGGLATLSSVGLRFPGETDLLGDWNSSAHQWVSVTGDMDPVGGHLVRKKLDWAYMDIPGQESEIDQQALVGQDPDASLTTVLRRGLSSGSSPSLSVNNPHSWNAYIERHAEDLTQWLA